MDQTDVIITVEVLLIDTVRPIVYVNGKRSKTEQRESHTAFDLNIRIRIKTQM